MEHASRRVHQIDTTGKPQDEHSRGGRLISPPPLLPPPSRCRRDPSVREKLAKFRGGKTNLSKFFMGQAFKATRGRADGKLVEDCVMRLLRP